MPGLKKNTASQKVRVFAFNDTDSTPVTGDAANITGKIALDWATAGAITDTNPTETEDGYYLFDLTQAETNADVLDIYPESSTANVQVVGVPGTIYTVPEPFFDMYESAVQKGTASGTPTTTTMQTDLTEADDFWNKAVVVFTSGSQAGERAKVSDFLNSSGTITFSEPLTAAPSASDEFIILGLID